MVSWGNLANRLEQWAASKYAVFDKPVSEGRTIHGVGPSGPWESEFPGWKRNTQGVAVDGDGNVYTTPDSWLSDELAGNELWKRDAETGEVEVIKDDLPSKGGNLDFNYARDTLLWAKGGR